MAAFTDDLRSEYKQLFDTCIIKEDKLREVDGVVAKMLANKATYDVVANKLNIPWYFIAIVHCMEGSLNFKTHLHNGDPLSARTVQVPKGRPIAGKPPFKWEDSAVDALTLEHLAPLSDTTVPALLFAFEGYNGFGSRARGIHSPYLWSFSNHYTSGKFVKDHVFDPNAVSKQMGAGVLLRRMMEKQLTLGVSDVITQIRELGEQVKYDPKNFNEKAFQLQSLLNSTGLPLKPDGKAGDHTSEAYEHISGKFLNGDKRRV